MVATMVRGECRKAGCGRPRGRTPQGLDSLMCQVHIDLAAARLRQFVHDHGGDLPVPPEPVPEAVFRPPADPCARCGLHPRGAADSLCEECREG